ncbi:histidine kinase, partial [Streptomyces violarus]|nr:histidine kinase [Streptomyces violarus]
MLPVTAWMLLGGALVGLVVLDWAGGLYWIPYHGPAKLIGALVIVALAVVSPRLDSRALPVAACVCAVGSLCLSVWIHLEMVGASQPLGFAEPAALVWLLLLVARRGKPSWVALAVPLLGMAIVLRPVSVSMRQSTTIMA